MEVKLVVVGGVQAGKEIPVPAPKFLIGRGPECRLRTQSNLVSRKHCAILIEENAAAIEDFGSTNGTHVNGVKIQQRRRLKNGDRSSRHNPWRAFRKGHLRRPASPTGACRYPNPLAD